MKYIHLVARTELARPIFENRNTALYAWNRLRAEFPRVLAAMLMPEHLHVVIPDAKDAIWRLGVALRSVTRRLQRPSLWEPIPEVRRIADPQHLRRTVRYVLLNPCRRKLVSDPLQWEWSTHRDLLGLVQNPWVKADTLQEALGYESPSFVENFHRYVCREDCVSPSAQKMPRAQKQGWIELGSLTDLEEAYAIYRKIPKQHCKQRGPARTELLQLALHLSQASREAIAKWAGISPRILHRYRVSALQPELLELGTRLTPLISDRRLLAGFSAPKVARRDFEASEPPSHR
jgi:hypothetical protein